MAAGKPRIAEAKIADLSFYDRNPRKISPERLVALKRSLEADREMLHARPLIALLDGRVICGNQRLLAAQELGWTSIPTVHIDLDDARARTWVLRDNNGYGEWDDTLPAFPDLISKLPAGDVYEPFAGSGTCLIAAETLGRRCFALEIDPVYCDVIRQRYADYTDQPEYTP